VSGIWIGSGKDLSPNRLSFAALVDFVQHFSEAFETVHIFGFEHSLCRIYGGGEVIGFLLNVSQFLYRATVERCFCSCAEQPM
jgi:hypothetical protein